jgi:hypothetical protein
VGKNERSYTGVKNRVNVDDLLDLGNRWRWLRGLDLNQGPLGYEPNELPDCSTPQLDINNRSAQGQTTDIPAVQQS